LDDVARHLILCNRAREDARKLLAMADKIEEAVYEDLVPIHEHEGRMPSIPTFDGWGSRNMGPDGGLSEQAYERYITGEVEVSA
jgi:hypothetical protein